MSDNRIVNQRGTTNRLVCAVVYWFWESHASWPKKVTHVYSWKEYQTHHGHVWIERGAFWRTLWRATGMLFVGCKNQWDRWETRIWKPAEPPENNHGM